MMPHGGNQFDINALRGLVDDLGRAPANGRPTTPIIRAILAELGYQLSDDVDASLTDDAYEQARVAAARDAVIRRRGAAARARRLAREEVQA